MDKLNQELETLKRLKELGLVHEEEYQNAKVMLEHKLAKT
jgi:hypothetical protein